MFCQAISGLSSQTQENFSISAAKVKSQESVLSGHFACDGHYEQLGQDANAKYEGFEGRGRRSALGLDGVNDLRASGKPGFFEAQNVLQDCTGSLDPSRISG